MGGERASTARQRLAGKICCWCGTLLDAPPWPGERACDQCDESRQLHEATLHCARGNPRQDGWLWHLRFVGSDRNQTIGRMFHLKSDDGLRALLLRTRPTPAAMAAFETKLAAGHSSLEVPVQLDGAQMRKLRQA